MSLMNTQTRYGSVMKVLHWLSALLVVGMLALGFLMDSIQPDALKYQIFDVHKLLGLAVLLLAVFFLLWRWVNVKPAFFANMPAWECWAARIVHVLLYLALLAMPLSGWVMATASGYPPHLGAWDLPAWGVGQDAALAKVAQQVHTFLAWSLVALVSLHTLAALKHHFVDRDAIFKRMLPGGP